MSARDRDKMSTRAATIRTRLRRGVKHVDDLEKYIEEGYMKPLDEWDIEELARGRPRCRDGHFRGPAPKWLTIPVQREAKRRLLQHTFGEMASHVDTAVKVIVDLMKSEELDHNGKPLVDSRTKLAAAQFVIEHILGKPKASIEIDAQETVKDFLADALVIEDGQGGYQPAHPVTLEGEYEVMDDDEE